MVLRYDFKKSSHEWFTYTKRSPRICEGAHIQNFTASNGRLQSFLKRHRIVFGTMSGERADGDNTVVHDLVKNIPEFCDGYFPEDILHGLDRFTFDRQVIRYFTLFKGDGSTGSKQTKVREHKIV